MKRLALIIFVLLSALASCDEKECPDDMDECTLQDGTKICVPKGKC